jgi:hypothetical protein
MDDADEKGTGQLTQFRIRRWTCASAPGCEGLAPDSGQQTETLASFHVVDAGDA